MARAKKEAALTPEERLQAALVPDWEWQYKLPENWCWTKLGVISAVKGGKRLPKGRNLLNNKTVHPYIRVTDFDSNSVIIEQVKYIDEETFHYIQNYTISSKDIYISIAGTIGKVGIIPDSFDGANLTENAAKITDINGINQKYLLWVLNSEFAQLQMKDSTISTTQPKLALFRIENIEIPIPPLAEQQRIVDRIESLFAKLDEAKEKAQAVVDSFETRKAAILHKAFTGELTANWREAHGANISQWKNCTIGDVFAHTTGKALKKSNQNGVLRKYITTSNLYWGTFDFSEVREMYFTEDELGKCTAKKGDLLLCNGGDVGRAAIWDYDYEICLQNHISKLRKKAENVDVPFFYYYFMLSKIDGNIAGRGIGIASLSARDLLSMNVYLPPVAEQQQISRILDGLFAKEQQAKEAAEAVLEKIDLMKKAILARAFRGELGTNVPNDEPAVELLKKII